MSLFIEVNEIDPEGVEIDRVLSLPTLLPAEGTPALLQDVRILGRLSREGGDFVFLGQVSAMVTLACGRCLADYTDAVDGACYRIYRRGSLVESTSDGALGDHGCAMTPFDGNRINLAELAQEQIYLLLPLKPLCKEDCRGLCPHCGANCNVDSCSCQTERQGQGLLTLKIPF